MLEKNGHPGCTWYMVSIAKREAMILLLFVTKTTNKSRIYKMIVYGNVLQVTTNNGNAIGTAGAVAPPQKEEIILVGRALTILKLFCF